MNTTKTMLKNAAFILVLFLAIAGCKKTDRPAMGDYPKDSNPPGGPLKFYVAFDGATTNSLMNAVDSTRANFPSSNTGTVGTGISGKSFQGSASALATYAGLNEFTKGPNSNFTIAFWLKNTPQAPGSGTAFVFCLNAKDYSWTNAKLFLEFEDYSTTTAAAGKFYIMDQWVEYINANTMPNVLNGQWHQLAFTYTGATSTLVCYIDGVAFKTNTIGTLGTVNFGTYNEFTIGGPNAYTHAKNGWMNNFAGGVDQFRIYSTVLTAGEVQALYASKQ